MDARGYGESREWTGGRERMISDLLAQHGRTCLTVIAFYEHRVQEQNQGVSAHDASGHNVRPAEWQEHHNGAHLWINS